LHCNLDERPAPSDKHVKALQKSRHRFRVINGGVQPRMRSTQGTDAWLGMNVRHVGLVGDCRGLQYDPDERPAPSDKPVKALQKSRHRFRVINGGVQPRMRSTQGMEAWPRMNVRHVGFCRRGESPARAPEERPVRLSRPVRREFQADLGSLRGSAAQPKNPRRRRV
jgi:hypothetical protein